MKLKQSNGRTDVIARAKHVRQQKENVNNNGTKSEVLSTMHENANALQ